MREGWILFLPLPDARLCYGFSVGDIISMDDLDVFYKKIVVYILQLYFYLQCKPKVQIRFRLFYVCLTIMLGCKVKKQIFFTKLNSSIEVFQLQDQQNSK